MSTMHEVRHRTDGGIDFDHYRAIAAAERRQVRRIIILGVLKRLGSGASRPLFPSSDAAAASPTTASSIASTCRHQSIGR